MDIKLLHKTLSDRLSDVPDFNRFCEASRVSPQTAKALNVPNTRKEQRNKYKQPDLNNPTVGRMATYENHDILVFVPTEGVNASVESTGTKIHIETPDGAVSYTVNAERGQRPSLCLRFPSTLGRDGAYYKLRTNQVTVDESATFKSEVQNPNQSKEINILRILEVDLVKLPRLLDAVN